MTNEKLCSLKIDIQIKDEKDFQKVCYLLDSPTFLSEIEESRDRLHIKNLVTKAELPDLLQEDTTIPSTGLPAVLETDRVLKRLKLSEEYWSLVFSALLTGSVGEFDLPLSSNSFRIFSPNSTKEVSVSNPCIGVFITPYTKLEDLKQLLSTPTVKKYLKTFEKYYSPHMKNLDTASNVIRDRDLYWMKLDNESWNSLAKHAGISREGVRSAVASYKNKVLAVLP